MRLIDADAYLKKLRADPLYYLVERFGGDGTIEAMPTIDAEPVRHGAWIENDNGTYSCSKCKSWIPKEQHYYARYCLHCGALMDEVEG